MWCDAVIRGEAFIGWVIAGCDTATAIEWSGRPRGVTEFCRHGAGTRTVRNFGISGFV
jgi:hypothetical protein